MPGQPIRTPDDLGPLEAKRIAVACRHEAFRLRQRLRQGLVPDPHVHATEDRITSLTLGEQVMLRHANAWVADDAQRRWEGAHGS